MKKLLLSVSVLAMSLGTTFAQTVSTGFVYDFSSTATGASNCLLNCCPTYVGAIYSNGDGINSATSGVISQGTDHSFQIISDATLTGVQNSGSQNSNGYQQNPLVVDIYRVLGNNCSKLGGGSGYIDISANKRVTVTAKASAPMNLRLELGKDFSAATNSDKNIFEMNVGTSYQDFTFDYTGKFDGFDSTQINVIRFKFNVGTSGGVNTGFTGTVNIAQVRFGSAANASIPTNISSNDDFSANNQVSVYPNPASDKFTVDLSYFSGSANVRLVNTTGSVVSEQNASGSASFSLEGLSKGMYFVQISADNRVIRKKIMVD